MMAKSKHLTFGRWAECRVFAELVKRGFDLYTPLVDDKGIDCIVRKGREFLDYPLGGFGKIGKAKQKRCK
jgi:hypothetical protein